MSPRLPTIWPLQPHTAAKHSIFSRHLSAWIPKLAWTRRLEVVDGFAGPGEYTGGEPGSPVIAIGVARDHQPTLLRERCRVSFTFVEEDSARFSNLEARVGEMEPPVNVAIALKPGTFVSEMNQLLDSRAGGESPPLFVMIDPFGFEGAPMALIRRISTQNRSEVLISFMYDSVTRWLGDSRNESNFDALFGCEDWRGARDIEDPAQRRDFLLGLYVAQLKGNGWTFTRTFEMKDAANRTEYFLVFATNNIEGLKVIKEAMWKVDPTGSYTFSDATDRRQLTLFRPEPDYDQLQRIILGRFGRASQFTIDELEYFVLTETAFRETHYKGSILRPMEMRGELYVIDGRGRPRRGVYREGTVLRFTAPASG